MLSVCVCVASIYVVRMCANVFLHKNKIEYKFNVVVHFLTAAKLPNDFVRPLGIHS